MEEGLEGFMELYGELFANKLKEQLRMKIYPYRGNAYRPAGVSDKVAGVHYGYPQSLVDSIESQYDPNNNELVILMNDYWRWVNDGRQPGTYAPIKPLQLWAMKRLGLDEQQAKSAAFGISKNIYKFGIKPTYFYDLAVEALSKQLEDELYNNIGLSIETFLENTFEEGIEFSQQIASNQ